MQTKTKSNSVITTALVDGVIVFTVRDAGELRLPLNRVSAQVKERAMVHGLVQRVSDAAALSRNPENGQPATPADKLRAMERLVAHYESGSEDWAIARAGGEGRGPNEGLTIRAMGDVFHKLAEECRDMVKTLAEKRGITEREALGVFAKSDKVAARIAQIKAETSTVSADDLLGELAGEAE